MRRLALALLVVACKRSDVYFVSVGSDGKIVPNDGCVDPHSRALRVDVDGGLFEAMAPGEARVECRSSVHVYRVESPARLEIEGPATMAPRAGHALADYAHYTLHARSASGEDLDVGEYSRVEWEATPPFDLARGCHGDILPFCWPARSTGVRSPTAATGTLTVRFAGLTASVPIEAR